MSVLQQIITLVEKNDRFLITAHQRPDGDSIGSQLALAEGLRKLGKHADIVNVDPYPKNFRFLPGIEKIRIDSYVGDEYQVLFILECNNFERSGLEKLNQFVSVNVDHHPKNDHFGDLNWVDSGASAVGMLIYHLLREMGVSITPEIAINLYVAILTDTGSFQFSNTNAETFAVARELASAGADPGRIAQSVMMSQSESKLRLLARLLATLDFDPSRRIAWICMDQQMLAKTGASHEDTEGVVNYPLSVEGVLLCAFFREEGHHFFRVSLRSKNGLDVGSVAEFFGGGGHRNAAGLSIEGPFREVRDRVLGQLTSLLPKNANELEE
jgi:phosphoesterase RecJ-like protein